MEVFLLLITPIFYLLAHELIHYIVARILGFSARLQLSSDGVLPSLGVLIDDSVDDYSRVAILYSPYIVNAVLMLSHNCFVRVFALLTLPNSILEDERYRGVGLIIAVASIMLVLILLEKYNYMLCT